MISINQISTEDDIKAAGQLVRALTTWAISLDPDTADAPTFEDIDAEMASLPGKYAPPTGCFLLAREGRVPVGCVAYLARGNETVELKRMYVDPGQRGKGVGVKLVLALIENARRQGARRIVLDSYHTMHSAHKIYRNLGFKDVSAPQGFPENLVSKVVFMEMDLA